MAGQAEVGNAFSKPIANGHRFLDSPEYTEDEKPFRVSSPEDDEPPTPPLKDFMDRNLTSPVDVESYFSSFKTSRANSVYSLSRMSFSSQLSQLTSLNLPNAPSLSTSISAIANAPAAAMTLSGAAEKIRRWLQKASEVLGGLDAEDDVEWAAAGGREGLEEVDTAIGKFESLVGVYVTAIEALQEREDIGRVPTEELKTVVDQMEKILSEWEKVRTLLKGVKVQVELAMEWEELWNIVLGDIGLEMENLSRLVFEMEETRHKAMFAEPSLDSGSAFDMQELETIVEEAPVGGRNSKNHRFSLPPAFAASSPIASAGIANGQEDSSLLALFARMQPLRASLDFLPMRLSNFNARADTILPTACQELEARREGLEKKWRKLESDAEGLRRELGEDRWVLVFRNAGRQAQKLCESIERSIIKLQDSIDGGSQHSNPPALAKKVENYEAKKTHYGPAIERVISIIEKGVKDRLTVNGEILRLQLDTRARWTVVESEMKDMDLALDDLNTTKTQQLRDSISSIVSIDQSAMGSSVDTPRSSPASSVGMGPTNGRESDAPIPSVEGASRRSSVFSSTTTRPAGARRYFNLPPGLAGATHLPRKTPISKSMASDAWSTSRSASPSPYASNTSTPTPVSRSRPSPNQLESRPRWNSSPKVNHFDFSPTYKPPSHSTPVPHRKSSMSFRSPRSVSSYSASNVALPSPLGRSASVSSPPLPTPLPCPRDSSEAQPSPTTHESIQISSSPTRPIQTNINPSRPRQKPSRSIMNGTPPSSPRGQSTWDESSSAQAAESSSPSSQPPKHTRPGTALANGRRISMLPVPRHINPVYSNGDERERFSGNRNSSNGRASVAGTRPGGRNTVMEKGEREWKWK